MMIHLLHAAFVYQAPDGEVEALRDVSLDVEEGEFCSIVGPSGCGKSTLLSVLAGLETLTGGEVTVDGETLRGPSPKVGFMPQQDQLFPWRSIWDNVTLALAVRGENTPENQARVRSLLERYGLWAFRDKRPGQLSGGMRQRCALIRTLAADPRILLLDEPFSALDSYLKWNLELELSDLLAGFHGPILWVSHELGGSGTPFRILRIIPDAGHAILLLQPEGAAEGSPVLRAECDAAGTYAAGQALPVSFREEKLLFF